MEDKILKELVENQIKYMPIEYKLNIKDIIRIRKNISTSIFDKKSRDYHQYNKCQSNKQFDHS